MISNSYMVTNRDHPWEEWATSIYPAPSSENFYFLAPGANNPNSQAYQQADPNPTRSMPSSFQSRLEADIVNAVQAGGPQVTVFIHGLSYYLSDACNTLGAFGQNLAAQGYKGLLVGFSWPSYGITESYLYYGSLPYRFPPTAESGTIRDNIYGSIESLLNLLSQLVTLCRKHGARLNLVCHSEGNYMLMLAMSVVTGNAERALSQLAAAGPFIDQTLMVAADINNGALQPPQGSPPVAGQGSWIAQYSNTVTAYWSRFDDLLPFSDGWTEYHNPSFPKRLGLWGLASDAPGTILPNAYGLDCSLVVNGRDQRPPLVSVHESYFYVPQVLLDMTQTLGDVPPARVVHRVSTGNQSFQMTLVPAPLTSPFRPLGTRLPKAVPVKT